MAKVIVDTKNITRYSEIKVGDIFISVDTGRKYLKSVWVKQSYAVNLETGEIMYLSTEADVINCPNAVIHIKGD